MNATFSAVLRRPNSLIARDSALVTSWSMTGLAVIMAQTTPKLTSRGPSITSGGVGEGTEGVADGVAGGVVAGDVVEGGCAPEAVEPVVAAGAAVAGLNWASAALILCGSSN